MKTFEEYKEFTLDAVESYNKKDYQNALSKFLKLAEKNYDNYKIHEILCTIYLKLENIEEAEKEYSIYFDLLKKQIPDLPQKKNFNELIKDLDDIDELEKKYTDIMEETALPEDDSSFSGKIQLSNDAIHFSLACMANGDYERAEKIIREFIQKYKISN